MRLSELQRLKTQYDVARALHNPGLDIRAILQTVLSLSGQAVSAEHGCVVTLDDDGDLKDAFLLGASGDPAAEVHGWELLLERGLIGFVRHSRRTIHIRSLSTDPRWPVLPDNPVFPRSGSALGLSLQHQGRLYGVLLLVHQQVDYFDREMVAMLEEIAHITGSALAKAHPASPQDADQLRSDLSLMVYHDLRGPLQNILSSLSSLGRLLANHDNQAVMDLLQVGTRSARQLSRLVESLLNIQQIEEGQAILDRKPVSLHRLLSDAADLVQPMALEAGQSMSFAIADDLPSLAIDGDMILRVVTNLLENAVKYSPDGGKITLAAVQVADGVSISIADTGPGIPPDKQDMIFNKFSRIRDNGPARGVGLGLAFCRLAVEAHGGRIWVESKTGQGSVFHFTLPLEAVSVQPVV